MLSHRKQVARANVESDDKLTSAPVGTWRTQQASKDLSIDARTMEIPFPNVQPSCVIILSSKLSSIYRGQNFGHPRAQLAKVLPDRNYSVPGYGLLLVGTPVSGPEPGSRSRALGHCSSILQSLTGRVMRTT